VTAVEERVAAIAGARPARWERCAGGYTASDRWIVELDDGRRVFVKHATSEYLAGTIRAEHRFYVDVGPPYAPRLVGFDDSAGEWPLLVLEDLSDADWTPRWTSERVAAVRSTLREVAATPPPEWARPVREEWGQALFGRWEQIAAHPEPFLSLGFCTRGWFERAYPALRDAAESAPVDGDSLLHFDVRSDNLCFREGGRVLLVDWNWVCVGNADLDLAAWLPSLAVEKGPRPYELLPGHGGLASLLAGVWGLTAGLPPPETARPDVRELQRLQLEVALEWARVELAL
jgi:hypothetical protein